MVSSSLQNDLYFSSNIFLPRIENYNVNLISASDQTNQFDLSKITIRIRPGRLLFIFDNSLNVLGKVITLGVIITRK